MGNYTVDQAQRDIAQLRYLYQALINNAVINQETVQSLDVNALMTMPNNDSWTPSGGVMTSPTIVNAFTLKNGANTASVSADASNAHAIFDREIELAGISTPATPSGAVRVFADTNGDPNFVVPGGWAGRAVTVQTDTSQNTANTTGFQSISKGINIPGGSLRAGTFMRMTSGGTFSIGTTSQVLTFAFNLEANTTIQLPIGSAEFAVSTSFWWIAQGFGVFNSVGASGDYFGGLHVALGVSGGNQATVAATSQTAGGFAAYGHATSVDTTGTHTSAIQAKWGATTGSPTISGFFTIFERG